MNKITKDACFETSLLELWASDNYGPETEAAIQALTKDQILDMINQGDNNTSDSLVFRRVTDFSKYLGGIERDSQGRIVSAKATFIRFFGKINASALPQDGSSRKLPVSYLSIKFS